MKPIWIVDDDQSIRFVLEKALEKAGLPVRSFSNTRDVQAALNEDSPQVLVSDIRMPGGSGIDLLQEIKRTQPLLPVIIMTAYSDLDSAVSAFQSGAFEYLSKPFDLEKAVDLIQRAVDESMREQDIEEARIDAPELLGQAPAMQDLFRAIGRLSPSQVTVLITGESGSGKELVAQALHRHSPRANGPFVAINTAAIPRDLLESELFGHERGAFTGAQTSRRGRFEQAEGGTLFLDEIGDMPYELQTRLLRVLSDGHYYRVGGHNPIKAHVRVIAATHQNLESRVRDGLFREDLFHRLNVIRLRLPALRERREDIVLFGAAFHAEERQRSWGRCQTPVGRSAGRAAALSLSGQCARAGERVPLAHRHGPWAHGGCERPAARVAAVQPRRAGCAIGGAARVCGLACAGEGGQAASGSAAGCRG
jgi:Response regulator containing CheY-like receiver, AAA-type ATPase, and DNA-binding domains